MAKGFSHFGIIYSRKFETGEKSPAGNFYGFEDFAVLSFGQLNKKTRVELESKLVALEKKHKFPVESVVYLNEKSGAIKFKFTRKSKLPPRLYPKILLEMKKGILAALPLEYVNSWFSRQVTFAYKEDVLCQGERLGFGVGIGKIFTSRKKVQKAIAAKKKVIWVLDEVETEDLKFFKDLEGLVLVNSGPTSHASVVAKGLGIPTLLGCAELAKKDYAEKTVTLDANKGVVYRGGQKLSSVKTHEGVQELLSLALKNSKIDIYANADNGDDAKKAYKLGAKGIGLCRTEHMFFSDQAVKVIRKILFSEKPSAKEYQELLKIQSRDFLAIFRQSKKKEVVVRLLDAPLHEFLPRNSKTNLKKESNPMLGFRGIRMLLKKPEILRIQVRAVQFALSKINKKERPKIIFEAPLVIDLKELDIFKDLIEQEVGESKIGAMIETPRAAFMIKEIATRVDYISFGTNDLTQMFMAISRDDSRSFVEDYVQMGILPSDPFVSLDQESLLPLIRWAVKTARKVNPKIKIGVCGEQASEIESIKQLIKLEIDHISCSPARVPQAIFAVAKYSKKSHTS